jgi:hypothetical protein
MPRPYERQQVLCRQVNFMSNNSTRKKRTILFLATSPKKLDRLRLDEEYRDVSDALKRSKNRDQFDLKCQWAPRHRDVRQAMLELKPQIVHFSGHGAGEPGLIIEDETGQAKLFSTDALIGLFEGAKQVECVLLNACCSEAQAAAIAQYVPYVIGMNQNVGDRAALEFSVGFYDTLGLGLSFEDAYEEGCRAIRVAGIPEYSTPVLKHQGTKPDLEPEQPSNADEATQPNQEVESADSAIIVNMIASGENAKQIGQIGKIDNFTM